MTKTAAVIGAGPAGLAAAEVLSAAGLKTTVFEKMATPARKFLMAGRGGLNLTHSEDFEFFLRRYGDEAPKLEFFLRDFGPKELIDWCQSLGVETFVGSSGRVFPKSLKASPLLRAWLARLAAQGVEILTRHNFVGFDGATALIETPDGVLRHSSDVFVLALGGVSWPRLGADGAWVAPLENIGLKTTPLRPANAGVKLAWSDHFAARPHGQWLKNICVSVGETGVRGEAVVTRSGLEGGAIYALSKHLRESATLTLDLKPDVPLEALIQKLQKPRGKNSLSNFLRKSAGLDAVAVALLREAGPLPETPEALAQRIKALSLETQGLAGLERAISTAGGVSWDGLDENLMAKNFPGLFVAGEMLDWEAPTGGYLLTACFALGRAAGAAAAHYALNQP